MTVEDAGVQTCDICHKSWSLCYYVYAYDIEGLPIKNEIYGKMYCRGFNEIGAPVRGKGCWDELGRRGSDMEGGKDIGKIRRSRILYPYNGRVRHEKESSSHPCITCGTYIDNGFLFCPNDTKCIRFAKYLDICLGSKNPEFSNSSSYGNGIHNYTKYDYFGWIQFECVCGKKFKIKKDKETETSEKVSKYKLNYSSYRTIPGKLRHILFVKYNYKCNECGASKEETTLEIDHIIPWSKGGQTHIDNLQVLCKKCNRSKHARIWDDIQ
uniref:ORF66 n=1 Tax=Nitrosopumilaceae spindle-shaped virus TaxID=3065433 RepID=A0AAT9JGI4_9VIRU